MLWDRVIIPSCFSFDFKYYMVVTDGFVVYSIPFETHLFSSQINDRKKKLTLIIECDY